MYSLVTLSLFCLVGLSVAAVLEQPIRRFGQSLRLQAIKEKRAAAFDHQWMAGMKKRRYATKIIVGEQQDKTVTESTGDYKDMLWIGNITLGTPGQPFIMQFDTGSSNIWVPDQDCPKSDKRCKNKNRFNSKSSSSYKKNGTSFAIQYGSGDCSGFIGNDVLALGDDPKNQLTVKGQDFAQVTNMADVFFSWPMDGILGLAFPSIAVDGAVPPLYNAWNQKVIDQPVFSIFLDTEGDIDTPSSGGVYTFGGVDSTNCGKVIGSTPLTDTTWWEFEIDSVKAGSKYKSDSLAVVTDSGTSLIVGNPKVCKGVAKAAKAKYNSDYNIYLIKCNKKYDPITLLINGVEYQLTKDQLTIDLGIGDNWCLFGFYPQDLSELGIDFIFGDPFIRAYCNIHNFGDSPSVSFAKPVKASEQKP